MNLVKVTWMATMINRSESDMGEYYCEKPQLKRIQRLGGFMTDSEDSLAVCDNLSSYYLTSHHHFFFSFFFLIRLE